MPPATAIANNTKIKVSTKPPPDPFFLLVLLAIVASSMPADALFHKYRAGVYLSNAYISVS